MTYNRCVGTRYCSNNCPYKVRRFNFYNYTKDAPETMHMARIPQVIVRFRGVMEKCTYCTQRIAIGKLTARADKVLFPPFSGDTARNVRMVSSSSAFGDTRDKSSRVAAAKKLDRDYALLGELNVRPRTTYLAKLRNPNPELES